MTVFEKVNQRRMALWEHDFAKGMRNQDLPAVARLSSIPHMTFFIMGFKDILFDLQQEAGGDSVQEMVNEHCQEDNGHWQWFLNDLERIEVPNNPLVKGNWALFATMWSDETWPIRDVVYEAIHLGRLAHTSRLRMLMLEVIEAIFSVYAQSIEVLVKQMDMWETFEFFGKVHYDAENDHSSGSWLDGGKTDLESTESMTADELAMAEQMVDRLFAKFEVMFDVWVAVQNQNLKEHRKSA